ncbi:TPA: hypothetical protein QDZ34_003319 [Stenotrophomonas maltophilia]|uniref:hypothetical protein n=1 Tax=Stenotrophomonas sp. TaxID=69392 RepID=UPI0028A96F4F|nr:hypothetical protein [Stenotrophomonas sp.]HDS0950866.1 hypothetical protein [Stenotrophomonas maltophilia]HDS1027938.1 hypothetical protein [Stenotrophomonas maltophilia]HDS1031108.1 hypothetical protein [Stenotrophomonas maltophilia]HDS1035942.1 hypothetical protein [Stenotrophomonas maltophilia]HDS1041149.1 hypothetical protein [Stenotrophomonas maltophilia]
MQRLFVMFPDRGPGLGLLWLRLCLAAALCTPGAWAGVVMAVCALAVGLLLLGWLTPLSAVLACVGLWLQGAPLPLLLLPLALLLLGPGAYSLDARQFGRRLLGRRPPPNG